MSSPNLADTAATFLALLGPQKVLVSFAEIARTLDVRSVRVLAVVTASAAACIGAVCTLTAPWLATLFHIGSPDLELAAGVVFLIYAIGLVLGIHFDLTETHWAAAPDGDDARESGPAHPLTAGFRALLIPFVVSPLAVAAELEESLAANSWAGRWTVVGALALVVLFDAACVLILAPLLGRVNETILEVISRLLGLLLAAVAVNLLISGLTTLGVLPSGH